MFSFISDLHSFVSFKEKRPSRDSFENLPPNSGTRDFDVSIICIVYAYIYLSRFEISKNLPK